MYRLAVLAIVILVGLFLFTVGVNQQDTDTTMRVVYGGMMMMLIGSGALAMQKNLGEAARNLGMWALIAVVLSAVYVFKVDAQNFASRLTAGLIPGRAATIVDAEGRKSAILAMGRNGHYEVDATVNGVTVPMMIDTGATMIALTFEDADRLGLNPAGLNFNATVMTANGPAQTAYVTLPEIEVAGIRRTNVAAGIAQRGKLGGSLLGMNFLTSLKSFSFSGNEMTLQD